MEVTPKRTKVMEKQRAQHHSPSRKCKNLKLNKLSSHPLLESVSPKSHEIINDGKEAEKMNAIVDGACASRVLVRNNVGTLKELGLKPPYDTGILLAVLANG